MCALCIEDLVKLVGCYRPHFTYGLSLAFHCWLCVCVCECVCVWVCQGFIVRLLLSASFPLLSFPVLQLFSVCVCVCVCVCACVCVCVLGMDERGEREGTEKEI